MQRNYSTQHMNQNVNFTREAFRQTLDLFLETDTNKSNVTLSARSIEDALGAHRSKAWEGCSSGRIKQESDLESSRLNPDTTAHRIEQKRPAPYNECLKTVTSASSHNNKELNTVSFTSRLGGFSLSQLQEVTSDTVGAFNLGEKFYIIKGALTNHEDLIAYKRAKSECQQASNLSTTSKLLNNEKQNQQPQIKNNQKYVLDFEDNTINDRKSQDGAISVTNENADTSHHKDKDTCDRDLNAKISTNSSENGDPRLALLRHRQHNTEKPLTIDSGSQNSVAVSATVQSENMHGKSQKADSSSSVAGKHTSVSFKKRGRRSSTSQRGKSSSHNTKQNGTRERRRPSNLGRELQSLAFDHPGRRSICPSIDDEWTCRCKTINRGNAKCFVCGSLRPRHRRNGSDSSENSNNSASLQQLSAASMTSPSPLYSSQSSLASVEETRGAISSAQSTHPIITTTSSAKQIRHIESLDDCSKTVYEHVSANNEDAHTNMVHHKRTPLETIRSQGNVPLDTGTQKSNFRTSGEDISHLQNLKMYANQACCFACRRVFNNVNRHLIRMRSCREMLRTRDAEFASARDEVGRQNLGLRTCVLCSTNFQSIEELQIHLKSPEHLRHAASVLTDDSNGADLFGSPPNYEPKPSQPAAFNIARAFGKKAEDLWKTFSEMGFRESPLVCMYIKDDDDNEDDEEYEERYEEKNEEKVVKEVKEEEDEEEEAFRYPEINFQDFVSASESLGQASTYGSQYSIGDVNGYVHDINHAINTSRSGYADQVQKYKTSNHSFFYDTNSDSVQDSIFTIFQNDPLEVDQMNFSTSASNPNYADSRNIMHQPQNFDDSSRRNSQLSLSSSKMNSSITYNGQTHFLHSWPTSSTTTQGLYTSKESEIEQSSLPITSTTMESALKVTTAESALASHLSLSELPTSLIYGNEQLSTSGSKSLERDSTSLSSLMSGTYSIGRYKDVRDKIDYLCGLLSEAFTPEGIPRSKQTSKEKGEGPMSTVDVIKLLSAQSRPFPSADLQALRQQVEQRQNQLTSTLNSL